MTRFFCDSSWHRSAMFFGSGDGARAKKKSPWSRTYRRNEKARQNDFRKKRRGHPSRGTVVQRIPSRMTRNLCESPWYHIAAFCEMRAARAFIKKESRGAVPIGGLKTHEKTFFSEKRHANPSRGTVVRRIPWRMRHDLSQSRWIHNAAFCSMGAARLS